MPEDLASHTEPEAAFGYRTRLMGHFQRLADLHGKEASAIPEEGATPLDKLRRDAHLHRGAIYLSVVSTLSTDSRRESPEERTVRLLGVGANAVLHYADHLKAHTARAFAVELVGRMKDALARVDREYLTLAEVKTVLTDARAEAHTPFGSTVEAVYEDALFRWQSLAIHRAQVAEAFDEITTLLDLPEGSTPREVVFALRERLARSALASNA